jgi:hypothetical protein
MVKMLFELVSKSRATQIVVVLSLLGYVCTSDCYTYEARQVLFDRML